jgi:N6-L-threonylcarbamoyladenine synthase
MIILSIETSCDETAISIVEAVGEFPHATYKILGNALFSQIDIHREFGGVFPAIAKREHIATILPMLEKALHEAGLESIPAPELPETVPHITELLSREFGLGDQLLHFHQTHGIPSIDVIAVTSGPGLEPALWVGVNFAKAIAHLWNVPVIPIDHMEGHILVSVFDGHHMGSLTFPALALLVSGGHTELILMKDWGTYEKVGQTRDDAVGEAFDKVARLLGLPYPGGPEIGRMAAEARELRLPEYLKLPRPMLNSGDLDFSFSGLKTAVRYGIEGKTLTEDEKKALARDFENAAVEVLLTKSKRAIEQYGVTSFILGGGVSANTYLRTAFEGLTAPDQFPYLSVFLPDRAHSTDNSIMIALAGHARLASALSPADFAATIRANGNQSIDSRS